MSWLSKLFGKAKPSGDQGTRSAGGAAEREPVAPISAPTAPDTSRQPVSGDMTELPKPTDSQTQDDMECAIAKSIQQLSANNDLITVLASPHWGWSQIGALLPHIRKDSPRRAMNFAVTKIARAAASAGSRLCESELRIVIRDPGTTWDKDFGTPSSVLRLDFRINGGQWRQAVGVGCLGAGGPYLVWDWK